MRRLNLRNIDLNLLPVLHALLEDCDEVAIEDVP